MVYCYMKKHSILPQYLQFPEFLLDIPLTQTAKILYMVLYDRARLSRRNQWSDQENRIYIVFTINELCKAIGRGRSTVEQGLNDLAAADLIRRKKGGFSKPNHIYVRIPLSDRFSVSSEKLVSISSENQPSNVQKIGHDMTGFLDPNKVIETSNINQSNRNSGRGALKNGFTKSSTIDYSCEEGESL